MARRKSGAAFGERGERPAYFNIPAAPPPSEGKEKFTWKGVLESIPGVIVRDDRAWCSWDAAPVVASYLKIPSITMPDVKLSHIPGLERVKALGLPAAAREYQKTGARFLAPRSAAYLAYACRTGKTFTAELAGELAGADRWLVMCPAIAKGVWSREARRWTKRDALILKGRSGTRAFAPCWTCNRSGKLLDGGDCPDCKGDNGQSLGRKLYKVRKLRVWKNDEVTAPRCRVHVYVTGMVGEDCRVCLSEFIAAFKQAKLVVSSYDVLSEHGGRSKRGAEFRRSDLPGCAARIRSAGFDLAILDELHMRRGIKKTQKEGQASSLNARTRYAVDAVPRVWGLSATPIFGRTRDLYNQLDILTDGLFGDRQDFTGRYCLPGGAPVMLPDYTSKPIVSVKVGETVIGWDWPAQGAGRGAKKKFRAVRVLETFTRFADVVEVTLESGRKVRCTQDHLWANAANGAGAANRQRYAPVNVHRRGVHDEETGRLVGTLWPSTLAFVGPAVAAREQNTDYAVGYLHGVCDGDGTIVDGWYLRPDRPTRSAERRERASIRLKDTDIVDRICALSEALGLAFTRSLPDKAGLHRVDFNGSQALRFFYRPRRGNDDYWRGFLGGIYDAEGWGPRFAQYKAENPHTYDNIVDALKRFHFDMRCADEDISIRGGRSEFIRLWALIAPASCAKRAGINTYKKKRYDGELFSSWTADRVVRMRRVGKQKVYCIRTETGNFVAYGYGSKNCGAYKNRFGGWVDDGMSVFAETELPNRLAWLMLKKSRFELIGPEAPVTYQTIVIERKPGRPSIPAVHMTRNQQLASTLEEKLDGILESVAQDVSDGEKCIVVAQSLDNSERLAVAIEDMFESRDYKLRAKLVKAKVFRGDGAHTTGDSRGKLAEAYVAYQGAAVWVATIKAMGQGGVSLEGARTIHFADISDSPTEVIQTRERPNQVGRPGGLSIIFYVVEDSVDEVIADNLVEALPHLERVVKDEDAGVLRHSFQSLEKSIDDRYQEWARKMEKLNLEDMHSDDEDDDD